MKLTKDKRDQLILTVMMTVMAIGAVWLLLIEPSRTQITLLTGQVAAAEDKVAKAKDLLGRADQIYLEMKAVRARLNDMEAGMVVGDPNLWIRVAMDEFYRSGNYRVEIPNIGQPQKATILMLPDFPYKAQSFPISGTAFFHDFGVFLSAFENRFPYMQIQDLTLAPDSSFGQIGPEREKLAFRFELVVPVKPVAKDEI